MFDRKKPEIFQLFVNDTELAFTDHQKQILLKHQANILNQALFNVGLDSNLFLSDAEKTALLIELKRIVYFVGNAVPLFKDNNYTSLPPDVSNEDRIKIKAENLLKFLLVGTPFSLSALYDPTTLESLFTKRSPDFMKALRGVIHEISADIDLELLNKLDANSEKRFEIQLANILAIYTLCDAYCDNEISLPRKINGKWVQVPFHITCLPLIPDKEQFPELHKLFANEKGVTHDQNYYVYSYGLTPKDDSLKTPRFFLPAGTPPETGQGHLFAALTDFTPGYSIGETMYRSSRNMLKAWFEANCDTNKAILAGPSLGGALTLYIVSEMPQFIERVEAINSPGFLEKTLNDPLFQQWNNANKDARSPVVVHTQKRDPVKMVGYLNEDWIVTRTYPARHEPVLSSYLAHIRTFANEADSVCLLVNVKRENERLLRKVFTNAKTAFDGIFHKNISNKITANNEKQAANKSDDKGNKPQGKK
jgi:hypothetical protein